MPPTSPNTPEAFSKLWSACQCEDAAQAGNWYHRLLLAYQAPAEEGRENITRYYHNWQHLTACLRELEEARAPFASLDLRAIEMALWFHDMVYDPKSSTNEEESAQAASEALGHGHAPQALIDKVTALILATKTHPAEADPDTALLLDIDLSILGKPLEEYDAYEEAIRAEYDWVPLAIFCDRRHRILEKFLSRPHIYLTPHFRERYEAQARANLTRALQRLPLQLQ